jgi:hypothetical protein
MVKDDKMTNNSAGLRTIEALCKLIFGARYLGPEGGTLPWTINSLCLESLRCHKRFYKHYILFNANTAIFQLYHGESMLIFNEMMMKSAFY